MSDKQTELEKINKHLENILETQKSIISFEAEQKEVNKNIANDLRTLEQRVYTTENNYIILGKQVELTLRSINNFESTLKDLNDNQIKLIEQLKNNKEKTAVHGKLFFTMLTLNFSLILAVATQFIKKIIG